MELSFLQVLSEARGVSGDEKEVRDVLAKAVKPLADEVKVDTMGNLIVHKRGDGNSPLRVMLAAHMDEIGLMIMGADSAGFLRFRAVGGIDPRILPAKRVLVGRDKVPGIIGIKPVHLTDSNERKNVLKIEQLYIDIGAKSKEEALSVAGLGDYAVFDTKFTSLEGCQMGSQPPRGRVSGKAFDDRAGCFVLASILEQRYPCDLYATFTVQEEVGLRGARTAAYAINPDLAFALEGTVCDDSPREEDISPTTRMGVGPAITVADATMIADRRLVDLLIGMAEREGIPYQIKQPNIGGTDAGAMNLQREGVPVAAASVPCRYIHSPESVLDLTDLANLVRLMQAALQRLPSEWPRA